MIVIPFREKMFANDARDDGGDQGAKEA